MKEKDLPYGITMNDYLFKVDVHKLLDKIENFKRLNIKKMNEKQIRKEIMEVLLFDDKSVLQQRTSKFETGKVIYRIRKLKNCDIPNLEMKAVQDAWNPPDKFVRRQRLNKSYESLLYTCFEVDTALEETKIKENESFALICYEIIDDIKATLIGINNDFSEYDDNDRLKLRIINNFLKDEFTREVGEGNEHLYKLSEIIAKDYFDLPPRAVQDAWCYSSIANKSAINLCMRPDIATEKLKVKYVSLSEGYERFENGIQLNVKDHLIIENDKFVSVMDK